MPDETPEQRRKRHVQMVPNFKIGQFHMFVVYCVWRLSVWVCLL